MTQNLNHMTWEKWQHMQEKVTTPMKLLYPTSSIATFQAIIFQELCETIIYLTFLFLSFKLYTQNTVTSSN